METENGKRGSGVRSQDPLGLTLHLFHGFLASSIAFGVRRYSLRLPPSNLIVLSNDKDLEGDHEHAH
jgi:hypothetical protein